MEVTPRDTYRHEPEPDLPLPKDPVWTFDIETYAYTNAPISKEQVIGVSRLPPYLDRASCLKFLRGVVHTLYTHEADEWFRDRDGTLPFDPHRVVFAVGAISYADGI